MYSNPVRIEPLETRDLLSWPNAPLNPAIVDSTIIVNQKGAATIDNLALLPAGHVDAYRISFDTSGAAAFSTNGSTPTQLAYYDKLGKPTLISAGSVNTPSQIRTTVAADKMLTLAVQARKTGQTGKYGLSVQGPASRSVRPITVSLVTDSGYATGVVSRQPDYQFYLFTVGRNGDWTITAKPAGSLDVTMNVFDAAGKPVGGTFTSAINIGGDGKAETWTGKGLLAGAKYYVRVDGRGTKLGGYRVDVDRIGGPLFPSVSAAVKVSKTTEGAATPGQFVVSRAAGSNADSPLTVHYSLLGTAINGKDYKLLTGAVVIPGHQMQAAVKVVAITDKIKEPAKTVILTLRPWSNYRVSKTTGSTVTITDAPPPWPPTIFHDAYENSVYVNQLGEAVVKDRILRSAGQVDKYTVFFDDSGPASIESVGGKPTRLTVYADPDKPATTAAYKTATKSAKANLAVSTNKGMFYVTVAPGTGVSSAIYTLKVHGVASRYLETLPVNPANDAASGGSDISGVGDYDFFSFTTTKAGNWTVWVKPDIKPAPVTVPRLDAQLLVFDALGKPVGGGFRTPIDARGYGVVESWTGLNLPAEATYFIRVDGHDDSTGGYGVAVMKTDSPRLSVAATHPQTGGGQSAPAQLTITRAGDAIPLTPLRVFYTLTGTAANGVDYQRLDLSVNIPANAYSTIIKIQPVINHLLKTSKTVVLTIRPDPYYIRTTNISATATILASKP